MRFLIIILLLLPSCVSNKVNYNNFNNSHNLFELTIEEYEKMLINYNEKKDFPNIVN